MKVINVVGARPNFIKMAPIISAMNDYPENFEHILVHTGQHYDQKMSNEFFDILGMPEPDFNLGVGSGSHAEQTGKVMVAFEKVCLQVSPDLVIVVGDVNSTLACTLTAKKLGIKVAHVEAGLRSRDMAMPEEINRLCTDVLCDYLFTTDLLANKNLLNEGVPEEKIHFVGNVMIDTLLKHKAMASETESDIFNNMSLVPKEYAVLTLHRPSNVDSPQIFEEILTTLREIATGFPIIFPAHPRTEKLIEKYGFKHFFASDTGSDGNKGLCLTAPLSYLQFLHLNMHARMVFTDSGGLQEETTVLGVPCITLRDNTERPITCTQGTNQLVGNKADDIFSAVERIESKNNSGSVIPEKWDGISASRIVKVLLDEASK